MGRKKKRERKSMSQRETRLAGNKNIGEHYSLPNFLDVAQMVKNLIALEIKNPHLPIQET